MNKQFTFLRKLRFSRKAIDFSLVMLFIVIVTIPILFWRMTSEIDKTKRTLGEDQALLLRAPYEKEDTINYIEKSAIIAMPEILGAVATNNGYIAAPCGGFYDYAKRKCAIVNTGTQVCRPDILETFTFQFNQYLNNYISAYNTRSYTKMPSNNYDVYIEGNNIHAIATLPVKKGIGRRELDTIGTMWFAPSFTINYDHKLEQYKQTFDALEMIAQNCFKTKDPKACVDSYSYLTTGWTLDKSGNSFIFQVSQPPGNACYILELPPA